MRALGQYGDEETVADAALEFSKLYWELVDLVHWAIHAAAQTPREEEQLSDEVGVKPPSYGIYSSEVFPRPITRLFGALVTTVFAIIYAYSVYLALLPRFKTEMAQSAFFMVTVAALVLFLLWLWRGVYRDFSIIEARLERIDWLIKKLSNGKEPKEEDESSGGA